jgi:hypothetical protein
VGASALQRRAALRPRPAAAGCTPARGVRRVARDASRRRHVTARARADSSYVCNLRVSIELGSFRTRARAFPCRDRGAHAISPTTRGRYCSRRRTAPPSRPRPIQQRITSRLTWPPSSWLTQQALAPNAVRMPSRALKFRRLPQRERSARDRARGQAMRTGHPNAPVPPPLIDDLTDARRAFAGGPRAPVPAKRDRDRGTATATGTDTTMRMATTMRQLSPRQLRTPPPPRPRRLEAICMTRDTAADRSRIPVARSPSLRGPAGQGSGRISRAAERGATRRRGQEPACTTPACCRTPRRRRGRSRPAHLRPVMLSVPRAIATSKSLQTPAREPSRARVSRVLRKAARRASGASASKSRRTPCAR